jgi:hypothetical protein
MQQGRNGVTADEEYQARQKTIFSETNRNPRDNNKSREELKKSRPQAPASGLKECHELGEA